MGMLEEVRTFTFFQRGLTYCEFLEAGRVEQIFNFFSMKNSANLSAKS